VQLLDKGAPPAPRTPVAAVLRRLRAAVTVFFTLDGFVFASWVVRVPQVKANVHASAGALGLALLGVSGGAVVTMTLTGRLCHRFGSRRMTIILSIALCLTIMAPARMTSVATLALALAVFGMAYGGLNVAMNSFAVAVIGLVKRPIMSTFHAAFSFGGLLGAVTGGLLASRLSASSHLTIVGLFGLLVIACGLPLLRTPLPEQDEDAPVVVPSDDASPDGCSDVAPSDTGTTNGITAKPKPRGFRLGVLVVVFGIIAACTAYGEGALADWGALHLHEDLHTSAGLAAAGFAAFSVAMVIGRLTGTRVIERFGRTTVLTVGGLLAAGGMLIAALVPWLGLAIIGFVCVGLGLANLFPAAIGEAGALAGPTGVGIGSTIGYGGMLLGPPLIGFMADHTGLPIALTTISALAIAGALFALFAHALEARIHAN
jgi:MFS family permease